jgi:uncharacterized protein (TIGR03435 family)
MYGQLMPSPDRPLPSFEVASVRQSPPDSQGTSFQVAPLRFRVLDATVDGLIRFAYDIRSDDQLKKGPRWTSTERFDIDAKIDDAQAGATKKLLPTQQIDQYRLMMQSLLISRFALKVSTQMEELPVFALELTKGGPKMNPTAIPPNSQAHPFPSLIGWSRGEVEAHAMTMPLLSEELSGDQDIGGRPVIDETGLKGSYDFELHFTPLARRAMGTNDAVHQEGSRASAEDNNEVPLTAALEEQLGLKLSAQKAPVKVLVIDHVEQPSPN